jgi:hypothetical protein
MRTSRIDSALIDECARHYQVSARSVRTWRIKDDRRWRDWLQKRAGEQTRLPSLDFVTEAAVKITPEDEESQALRRYVALTELCDSAIARGDQVSVVPLLRSAEQAHKLLQVVRENRIAFEEKARKLLPHDDVMDFITLTFGNIRLLIETLPDHLAPRIDPTDAGRFAPIIRDEVVRILTAIADGSRESIKKFGPPLHQGEMPAAGPTQNSASNSASLEDSLAHSAGQ